jgi:tetratricopeptide (TPR) repeat protein
MARLEKGVFISYRRPNLMRALAICHKLTTHGYDVFFDRGDSQHEDFEQVVLNNIKTRAHFLILLTPSTLEGSDASDDLMRREIETALDEKRNIVCLFFEDASFSTPTIMRHLIGKMAGLKLYPGLDVPVNHFDRSINRLCEKFLNAPVDVKLFAFTQNVIQQKQAVTGKVTHTAEEKLTAGEWLERGNKYYCDGKHDEAISCFSAAIRLKPDEADFYNKRGLARVAKGDLYNATGDFTEAVRIRPDWAEPYNNRGFTLHLNSDLDGALQDYNEAIRLQQDLVMAYNNRGNVYLDLGDNDAAIRDYTLAIKIDPDLYLSYSNRGNAHRNKGDLDSAFQDCARAIHLKPDFAMAHNNQGNVRQEIGDLDGALQDYNEAIRLQPDESRFYYNRGNALYKKDDLNGAFDDYTEAISLKPGYINAYRNRALVHWTRANYQAVMSDLQRCLDLGENDPSIFEALHEAQKRLN